MTGGVVHSRLVSALIVSLGVAVVLAGCSTNNPTSASGSAKPVAAAPTSLHVQAGATDSATGLTDALAKIADGGTITLAAGTYDLNQLLTIDKSVQLVGAGMGQTLIVSTVKDKGVLFTGEHHFTASAITFSHQGATPGGAVWVDAGTVQFNDCRFTGATSNSLHNFYEALWLRGSTTGEVENCTADQSDAGIGISGTATPVIQGCLCASDSEEGVVVYGEGHPLLRFDDCSNNDQFGIAATDHAHVMIQSCKCSAEADGVVMVGQATGSISYCTCNGNSTEGIAILGAARFAVTSNTCSANGADGIGVVGTAYVTVSGNTCDDNANYGILFKDNARGAARDNECSGNDYGIVINSPASATLVGNTLDSNKTEAVGRW